MFAPMQDIHTKLVRGQFEHAETGAFFEYQANEDGFQWASKEAYPHKIYVRDGFRYARVLKTVAYVVTDETDEGLPLTEKWPIKKHRVYKT